MNAVGRSAPGRKTSQGESVSRNNKLCINVTVNRVPTLIVSSFTCLATSTAIVQGEEVAGAWGVHGTVVENRGHGILTKEQIK